MTNALATMQTGTLTKSYEKSEYVSQNHLLNINTDLPEAQLSKPSTILIVDDNPINLKVLYNTLTKSGYKVIPAQDAQSALFRLKLIIPDLILLDIMMPEMDGFELYENIRQYSQSAHIPVMFISALSDTASIEKGFNLGAVDYITKPFRAVEVLGRVSAHLRLKLLQDSLTTINAKLQTLLNRQQCILNGAGEGIFGIDENGCLTFINQCALDLLGFSRGELEGENIHNIIHHTDPEAIPNKFENGPILSEIKNQKSRVVYIERFYHRNGYSFPVELTVSSLTNTDGTHSRVVIFRDITERLKTEKRLKEAATVFEVSSEGIFITDVNGLIQQVNLAFSELTGYTAVEAIGQTPKILKSGQHTQEFYADMWKTLTTIGNWEGEIWNRRKDGYIFPEWEMITAIRDNQAKIVGYVAQFSDITKRKMTEEELRYRSNYDALTGLVNRSLMIERLDQAIKEHQRRERKLGVLFIDLDKFKQVNDKLGHHIGDILLQQVAIRIRQTLREIDTAARLGGDEFVVILTDLTSREFIEQIVMRLLTVLQQSFELEGHIITIGASIGISIFPDDGESLDKLLRNADMAMYSAKNGGRYRARFFIDGIANP